MGRPDRWFSDATHTAYWVAETSVCYCIHERITAGKNNSKNLDILRSGVLVATTWVGLHSEADGFEQWEWAFAVIFAVFGLASSRQNLPCYPST